MRVILLAIATAALVAPMAVAHNPSFPVPLTQCGPQAAHHYTAGTSLQGHLPLVGQATWRTTVALTDSCPFDGEGDFGVGGAFLPATHHGFGYGIGACVDDDFWGPPYSPLAVSLVVGANYGGGFITALGGGTGCAYGGGPPGIDGGWWVFLETRNVGTTVVAPTTGHITG